MTSRFFATASRAAPTSARLMSMVSPSGRMPARPMLISTRHGCGADLATVIVAWMRSAPCDPASTNPVTPSARQSAGPSLVRAAWVWMSSRPGTTILPRASKVSAASAERLASTAAMRPPSIATSRIASTLSEGSITRPPLMIRSYVAGAARTSVTRANAAAPAAAAALTNWRRFSIITDLVTWFGRTGLTDCMCSVRYYIRAPDRGQGGSRRLNGPEEPRVLRQTVTAETRWYAARLGRKPHGQRATQRYAGGIDVVLIRRSSRRSLIQFHSWRCRCATTEITCSSGGCGVVGGSTRTSAGNPHHHRLRRRTRDRWRRPHTDRERVVRREWRALRTGRQGRRRARAHGCGAGESGRQDGHAGDLRHPHPFEPDARDAHRRPAAEGVLRRWGGAESRSGHDGRVIPGSRADDAGPGEVLHGRARDHGAGTGAHDRAVLGHDDCGSPQGRAGRRGQEGRHHQDLGRRPHGHGEEAVTRALQRGHR